MEPPFKRPRLSIFQHTPSDDQLDTARARNDSTLKSKWEALFAKYSRDFTSVADEVDIITGEIIVNRGHLEGMQAETDAGQVDGRSLLRAISAAQEEGKTYPGFEEVVQSIEGIAETVLDEHDESSEDGGSSGSITPTGHQSRSAPKEFWSATPIYPYDSDEDSLFENNVTEEFREGSVDSLFDSGLEHASVERSHTIVQSMPEINGIQDDEDILARFGPQIGTEVLSIIQERQQAHIEPAWRIPKEVQPPSLLQTAPKTTISPSVELSPVEQGGRSIWKTARRTRDSATSSNRLRSRDESEDPLQEGFGDSYEQHANSDSPYDEAIPAESDEEIEHRPDQALLDAVKKGVCAYCHKGFDTKSRILAHWDRLLNSNMKSGMTDDLHDLEFIRNFRSHVKRRVRPQRLVIADFKVMVELHEGAGMSFDKIARSEVLQTRKNASQLQSIYEKHRTRPDFRETPEPDRAWSPERERRLIKLSQNPASTLNSVRREVKAPNELAVGNRLADIWLTKMSTNSTSGLLEEPDSEFQSVRVKHEDSDDDDLFVP